MEIKRNAIALPHIGRAIAIAFIFILIFSFQTCYALTPYNQMTEEQAQQVFDFILSNKCEASQNNKTNITKTTVQNFVNVYNNNIATRLKSANNNFEYVEQLCLTCSINGMLCLGFSNNTIGSTLEYLKLEQDTSAYQYYDTVYAGNLVKFEFLANGNIFVDTLGTKNNIKLFNNSNGQPIYENSSESILDVINIFGISNNYTINIKFYNTDTFNYYFINSHLIGGTTGDDPGSGDTPGSGDEPNSGDNTNNVDLTNIENGIGTINENLGKIDEKIPTSGDIQNTISGEVAKITGTLTEPANFEDKTISSGDFEEALNFEFEQDPYQNMWTTLTNGLSNALTGTNRTLTIEFRNENYTINLDSFSLQLPTKLKSFLAITSTVFLSWKMFKYIKQIIDKISSGNIDEVLEMNEEERNSRFILRGN